MQKKMHNENVNFLIIAENTNFQTSREVKSYRLSE